MSRGDRGKLTDELYTTSRTFARTSITAYEDDQDSVFLLHAATALEQLAKAFLASQHPSLLIDKDFDALLHVVGLPQAAKRPPSRMRTVGMETALQRCSLFAPALMRMDRELSTLREVRNGLVHLGRSAESSSEVLLPYLQATDILLAELAQGNKADYWGDSHPFVTATLSEAVESNREQVERLLSDSRAAFTRRFKGSDPSWKEEVVTITVSGYDLDRLERQLYECPACGSDALAEGHIEPDYEFDEEVDDGQFVVHADLKALFFYPQRLQCRVCGLHLDGPQQIDGAEVPSNWELPDPNLDQLNAWEARWADVDY
ncbi:MAG: hypothetical protein WD739_11005 [Actinomycetota bacterium]